MKHSTKKEKAFKTIEINTDIQMKEKGNKKKKVKSQQHKR